MQAMLSNQPYLLRAFYEWIVDSHCTPHLLVDTTCDGVNVPQDYIKDGRIVLNISAHAVNSLSLGNEWVTFHARFGGTPMYVEVPLSAVRGIYARENGEGIAFQSGVKSAEEEQSETDEVVTTASEKEKGKKTKPSLTVVK